MGGGQSDSSAVAAGRSGEVPDQVNPLPNVEADFFPSPFFETGTVPSALAMTFAVCGRDHSRRRISRAHRWRRGPSRVERRVWRPRGRQGALGAFFGDDFSRRSCQVTVRLYVASAVAGLGLVVRVAVDSTTTYPLSRNGLQAWVPNSRIHRIGRSRDSGHYQMS